MGWYVDRVVPRMTDLLLRGGEFDSIRARVCAGLEGEVLEVGFGSGRNVPHYPPAVRRVRAVDPATVGRRLAAERVAASPVPVEYVGLDGEQLPLEDGSVDHVLTTWTLCTIPDVDRALREMRRVLAPGGRLALNVYGPIERTPAARALADALDRRFGPGAAASKRAEHALHDPGELRGLAEGAGFRDVRVRTATLRVRFPSPREYVQVQLAATPLSGLLSGMEGGRQAALVNALAGELVAALPPEAGDGDWAFPQEAHVLIART
jgi:ubiquinone/menaquinone biosynthesis C-methylase UbiE